MPRLILQDEPTPARLPNAPSSAFGAQVGYDMQQTGRVAQALGQVLDQYAETDARARAVRFETDLRTEADRLLLDPDIVGREQKFDEANRKLADKYRPTLGFLGSYDARAGMAGQEVKSRFLHQTTLDAIQETRRNTELEVTSKALKAAQADTPEEAMGYFADIRADLENAGLYMTPAEQTMALQDAIGTGLSAMVDTNPSQALGVIDKMGTLLKPEVLSVYRDQAITGIKQAAAEETARARQARADADRAEKDLSDRAEDALAAVDANGSLSVDAVKQYFPALSPEAKRRWLDRARNGSSGSGETNPEVYIYLTRQAEAGQDITELTNQAYSAGAISKSDRDSILKTSRGSRIGAARSFISTALDASAFPTDPFAGVMEAQALQYFDEWAKDHPNATAEEAMLNARRQVSGALEGRPGATGAPNMLIRPTGVVMSSTDRNVVDVQASQNELRRMLDAGELDPSAFAQEAVKLKRISDAQDAKAERERRARELAAGTGK